MNKVLQINRDNTSVIQRKRTESDFEAFLYEREQDFGQNEASTENQFQSSENLPDDFRQKMESAFSTDFSSVNVYSNSEKAGELGAKAYTQGEDIHFAPGEYNPATTSGQQLIGHELTHVVQQQQGRVKSTTKVDGADVNDSNSLESEADTIGKVAVSGEPIQMKFAGAGTTGAVMQMAKGYISKVTHSRIFNGVDPNKKKGVFTKTDVPADEQVADSPKGPEYKPLTEVDVEDNDTQHIKKGTENAWLKLKGKNEFIHAEKIVSHQISSQGFAQSVDNLASNLQPEEEQEDSKFTKFSDFSEGITDMAELPSDALDTINDEDTQFGGEGISTGGTELAGNILGAGAGILGFVQSISQFTNAESKWDKLDAILSGAGSVADTTQSVAGIVEGLTESDAAKQIGEAAGAVSGVLGALQKGIATIKSIVELVELVQEEGKSASPMEYAAKATAIIENGLETAKSVLESVSSIMDMAGAASSFAGPILAAIDVPLKALSIIKEGVYFTQSAYYRYKLVKDRQKIMQQLSGSSGLTPEQIEGMLKEQKSAEGEAFDLQRRKDKWIAELADPKISKKRKAELEFELSGKNGVAAYDSNNKVLTTNIDAKIAQAQVREQRSGKYTNAQKKEANLDMGDLALATELQSANEKRMVRAGVQIAADCISIAGSITQMITLFSGGFDMGAGLLVGSGLKIAGASVKMGMPIIRWIKQKGRNKAASDMAKGKDSLMTKVFNGENSDAKKAEHRKRMGMMILKKARKLSTLDYATEKPQFDTLEMYIKATGVSPRALYKLNGQPQKQLAMLIKEMSKREYGQD